MQAVEPPPSTAKDAPVNKCHLMPCEKSAGESMASFLPSSAIHTELSVVCSPHTHKAHQWHIDSSKIPPNHSLGTRCQSLGVLMALLRRHLMTRPVLGPGVWLFRAGEVHSITSMPCKTECALGDMERQGALRLAVTRYPVSTGASESGRQPNSDVTSPWHCKLSQLPRSVLRDLCQAHP